MRFNEFRSGNSYLIVIQRQESQAIFEHNLELFMHIILKHFQISNLYTYIYTYIHNSYVCICTHNIYLEIIYIHTYTHCTETLEGF